MQLCQRRVLIFYLKGLQNYDIIYKCFDDDVLFESYFFFAETES